MQEEHSSTEQLKGNRRSPFAEQPKETVSHMHIIQQRDSKETVGHSVTTSHKEGTAWLELLEKDHTYKCDPSLVAESGDRNGP
jgi:hypothetical protein